MSRAQEREFDYSHKKRGRVLIQDLTDWSGGTAGMNEAEREWRSRASSPETAAAVTVFADRMTFGPHTLKHLAEEWAENSKNLGIVKIAFVSRGIEQREIPDRMLTQEFRGFHSLDRAVAWATE